MSVGGKFYWGTRKELGKRLIQPPCKYVLYLQDAISMCTPSIFIPLHPQNDSLVDGIGFAIIKHWMHLALKKKGAGNGHKID